MSALDEPYTAHGEYENVEIERRQGMEDLRREVRELTRFVHQTNESVGKLYTALVGIDGQNGLRGEIRETKKLVAHLEKQPSRIAALVGSFSVGALTILGVIYAIVRAWQL